MSNGIRYKTNKYLLGSLDTKGEYNPSFLDYQTYMSWNPNKLWTVDFIGNISENHYNFKPVDRETKFGTLENIKEFTVYFDGHKHRILSIVLDHDGQYMASSDTSGLILIHEVSSSRIL